ncbi:hypothetical protein E2562_018128 [Oryza meyeriana var. granulata]|uniref:Uncharacterized protein n=1 Tax=Oryza meyeriana var. granulata TaxID=110450 RepID=A0A6G1C6Y1_9ORYZ|nr:hypothetical protein E2562_018128 [Oryza meyeriana var. granulata]
MRRRPLGSSLSVSNDQRARGPPTDFAIADQDRIKRSLYRFQTPQIRTALKEVEKASTDDPAAVSDAQSLTLYPGIVIAH